MTCESELERMRREHAAALGLSDETLDPNIDAAIRAATARTNARHWADREDEKDRPTDEDRARHAHAITTSWDDGLAREPLVGRLAGEALVPEPRVHRVARFPASDETMARFHRLLDEGTTDAVMLDDLDSGDVIVIADPPEFLDEDELYARLFNVDKNIVALVRQMVANALAAKNIG